jgi:hypothetical protein
MDCFASARNGGFSASAPASHRGRAPGAHANGKERIESFFASFCSQKEGAYLP